MLDLLKSVNLALAFLLELAMLAAFGYWGFQSGASPVTSIGLGVGIPALVVAVWGVFMAPRASRQLKGGAYLAVKVLLFGLAVTALAVAGRWGLGIALGAAVAVNTVLQYAWQQ